MYVTDLGIKKPKDVVAVLRVEATISELEEVQQLIQKHMPYHKFSETFKEVIDKAGSTFTAYGELDD